MIRVAAVQVMPGGEEAVNVLNYSGSGPTDEADAIQRVIDFFNTINDFLHNNWELDHVDAGTYISSDSAPTATSVPGELAGNSTGPIPLPNQVALCLSYRAAGGFGRSFRGRMYLGGFADSAAQLDTAIGTSRPTGALMVALGSAFQTLRGPGSDVPQLCVKHAGSLVQDVVEEGYVDARWDTQRRRARQLARPERVQLTIS